MNVKPDRASYSPTICTGARPVDVAPDFTAHSRLQPALPRPLPAELAEFGIGSVDAGSSRGFTSELMPFSFQPDRHGQVTERDSTPSDQTVLIEDLIQALREKERMLAELKHRKASGWTASALAAWRRRFGTLVCSAAGLMSDR
jgi:hypothetical protein